MAEGQTLVGQGAVYLTFKASEVMATAYIAVALDTTAEGYVIKATNDLAATIGILHTTAAAVGDTVRVQVAGVSYAYANTTVSIGDMVNSVDTTGYMAVATANKCIIGTALTAATAAGDLIAVLLCIGATSAT